LESLEVTVPTLEPDFLKAVT